MNIDEAQSPLVIRQSLYRITKKNNLNRRAYSDSSYKIKRSPVAGSRGSSGSTTPTPTLVERSAAEIERAVFEVTAC